MATNVRDGATGALAPYGLLSPAVKVIEDNDPHWQDGFTYETLGCAGTTTLHGVCTTASAGIVERAGELWRDYRPFEVQTTFSCSTMSRKHEELEAMARNELDIVVQKAIEREFLNGALTTAEADAPGSDLVANRFLSDDEATSLLEDGATPVKLKQGIALLEDAIAYTGNGAQGVIHVPRSVATVAGFEAEGSTLYTGIDTPVVAGVGYSPAPGETDVILYATGAVTVRLGPVVVIPDRMSEAIDRKNNTSTYVATRVAAVTWDSCVHFSVPVDLSLEY